MALVLSVRAAATAAGSMLKVTGSMSTNTGRAPVRQMVPAVAKNVYAGQITSSPAPTSRAMSATSRASVPELTPMAWSTPMYCAHSASSPCTSGPRM